MKSFTHMLIVFMVAGVIVGIFFFVAFEHPAYNEPHNAASHVSIDLACLFGQLMPPLGACAWLAGRTALIGKTMPISALRRPIYLPLDVPPPRGSA